VQIPALSIQQETQLIQIKITIDPCHLSGLSKVFIKYIYVDMYDFCISNDLVTENNSGFKELDSTVNQLVLMEHSIYQSLGNYKHVCLVFFTMV